MSLFAHLWYYGKKRTLSAEDFDAGRKLTGEAASTKRVAQRDVNPVGPLRQRRGRPTAGTEENLMSSQRPPARHVHAAVSAAMQPKMPQSSVGVAGHVQSAVSAAMQPKMPQPQSSAGVASHVQKTISAAMQPKMSQPRPPAGFANHVQKAILAGANHSTVQMMMSKAHCPSCGGEFKNEHGLKIHLSKSRCGDADDMSDAESELSNWSSKTQRAKPNVFKSRSENQQAQFNAFREEVGQNFNIHTPTNLAKLVEEAGYGGNGNYKANTHVLVSHTPNIAGGERAAFGLTKLSSLAQAFNKSRVALYEGRDREIGNVHAEMMVIFKASGGDESQVDNCLAGAHLVVDKPICEDCYKWVLRANPSIIEDGHNPNQKRKKWENWTNPFD